MTPNATSLAFQSNKTDTILQNVRRYATEASKGGSNAAIYAALGAVALGGAYYYINSGAGTPHPSKEEGKTPKSTSEPAKAAFTGGEQGFLSLPLESVETINHNTKKFRFSLPEADMESGLRVACKLAVRRPDFNVS